MDAGGWTAGRPFGLGGQVDSSVPTSLQFGFGGLWWAAVGVGVAGVAGFDSGVDGE
jgi:hypothetical protein